ncbi:glycosyltransferase family 4 protein [Roseibium sp. RKSG952]|uniref:glycosyltransferase family 4 protein n=1 Tax=Roseibium sp. RKSG952 TaxID=2529384 RepID=UPI001FCC7218|nr:glycosyltransferase family 4 protein [Roseibium sp. RKSG952]
MQSIDTGHANFEVPPDKDLFVQTDKSLTVLQVLPELVTGGVERTTVDVARAIVEAGGMALVASGGGPLVADIIAAGGEHYELPLKSKNPFTMRQNVKALQDLAQARSATIVHARSRAPAWSAYFAAKRLGLPFVTTYHGFYKQKSRLKGFYNSVMARGDRVIANSHFTGRLIAERHPFSADRITVIQRGSDLDGLAPEAVSELRKQQLAASWGLAPGRPVILQLGRLTGWKGQRVVISAMTELRNRGITEPVAILAGDAQGRTGYLNELNQQIEASRIGDQVKLVGHCDDVAAALALSSVSVVASVEPEAFGRAAVEAQAADVPVIVSDLGAVPETVLAPPEVDDAERTGWRVPPGNSVAIADAIEHIFSLAPSERAALLGRARRHVSDKFSVGAMTGATLQVYRELLSSR